MGEPTVKLAEYGGGRFFATRHLAGQIRAAAETLLTAYPDEQITLDFSGTEMVTCAFADELVANLRAMYGDRIMLAGANADILDAIDVALARRADR